MWPCLDLVDKCRVMVSAWIVNGLIYIVLTYLWTHHLNN